MAAVNEKLDGQARLDVVTKIVKQSPTAILNLVGVRQLKAHLSAYLRAVAAGRTVVIGDRRKRPIARLTPIVHSESGEVLDRLEREGLIRRGRGRPGGRPGVARRLRRSVAAMVIEDRG